MLRLHTLGHTACLILGDKSFRIFIVPSFLDPVIWSTVISWLSDFDNLSLHRFDNHTDLLSILLACFPHWLNVFIIMSGRRFTADTPLVFPTNQHCALVAERYIRVAWHQEFVTILLLQYIFIFSTDTIGTVLILLDYVLMHLHLGY